MIKYCRKYDNLFDTPSTTSMTQTPTTLCNRSDFLAPIYAASAPPMECPTRKTFAGGANPDSFSDLSTSLL